MYCAKISANKKLSLLSEYNVYVVTPVNMKTCDTAKKLVIFRNKVFKTKLLEGKFMIG
jgi:hypothetical protein